MIKQKRKLMILSFVISADLPRKMKGVLVTMKQHYATFVINK